jgi:hypothetical protein
MKKLFLTLFVLLAAVSGFASGAAGYWAANSSMPVNNVSSPVLRSAVVSPLAAGAGHVAGGTTANLIAGQNLGDAFANSFDGIGKSMAIGGAIGVASTIGVSYASKVSPWTGKEIADKGGGNTFRYMTEGELKAIQETGLLRGGREGETFWTKDLYKSAAKAQNRLALPNAPKLRVEFEILNDPTLLQNGTKVLPANGMIGGGAEFMTLDPVKVKLINWQPLK